MLQVDIQVAMVLSISIILASLGTAATLVVCCFRRGCPLYDTCSGGYTRTPAGDLPGEYEGSDQDLLTPRLSSKRSVNIILPFHSNLSLQEHLKEILISKARPATAIIFGVYANDKKFTFLSSIKL